MVRTQLYLPDDLYKTLKTKAKLKNMSFASYVRIYLEKEATPGKRTIGDLREAFPFVGMFDGKISGKYLTNEELDKAIYDL